MSKEKDRMIADSLGLGDDIPRNLTPLPSMKKKESKRIKSTEIKKFQQEVLAKLSECRTHREALEIEVHSLAECVGIATKIFMDDPIADNAYQLSSLTNAHKTALSQLEKMKDPQAMLLDIEGQIRSMFLTTVKAMVLEIDKTKRQLIKHHPEDKTTIEDQFSRMMNAIQPETQNIYDDLKTILKRILGIR